MSTACPSAPVEAPPPYSTLPAPASAHGGSPAQSHGATPSHGPPPDQHLLHQLGPPGLVLHGSPPAYSHSQPGINPAQNLRLGYADFVPRLTQKRYFKENKYESHEVLVQRANSWLEENSSVRIVACETITWMARKLKDIFADSTLHNKSVSASFKTQYLRGLRLWYYADIFPSATAPQRPPIIVCKSYLPRENERFDQLVHRVNEKILGDNLPGMILSTETVLIPYNKSEGVFVDHSNTHWSEAPGKAKSYLRFLRVFCLISPQECSMETIGFQDFVPEYTRRVQDNQGYELFSEVMERASRWIARQQGVRFTNIQTLPVKIKKKLKSEERCFHTEHAYANGNMGPNQVTKYLTIIRVMFVTMSTGRSDFPPLRLTCKTFVPAQIRSATRAAPAEFETTRQVLDRVNQWLHLTGARTFGFETVPLRMQPLGTEATFSKNALDSRSFEPWLYHIRLYLDGEYFEPPGAASYVVMR